MPRNKLKSTAADWAADWLLAVTLRNTPESGMNGRTLLGAVLVDDVYPVASPGGQASPQLHDPSHVRGEVLRELFNARPMHMLCCTRTSSSKFER